jgi:hypothetical protein
MSTSSVREEASPSRAQRYKLFGSRLGRRSWLGQEFNYRTNYHSPVRYLVVLPRSLPTDYAASRPCLPTKDSLPWRFKQEEPRGGRSTPTCQSRTHRPRYEHKCYKELAILLYPSTSHKLETSLYKYSELVGRFTIICRSSDNVVYAGEDSQIFEMLKQQGGLSKLQSNRGELPCN